MGAISDGSFKDVAKYNKQMREQYTYLNGGGYETHSPWGAALSTALPSLFMTLTSKLGDSASYSESETDSGNNSESAVLIQADIDNELDAVSCSNISEVEAKAQTAQFELQEITNSISNKTSELTNINAQISKLSLMAHDEYDSPELLPLKEQLSDLEYQRDLLEVQIKTLETEQTEKQEKINTLIKSLQTLKTLQKQLKKAEGRDVIEDLTNEETKDFTKVLKKLQTAIKSGDEDNINKYALELEEAYGTYVKEHPGVMNITLKSGYMAARPYIENAKGQA